MPQKHVLSQELIVAEMGFWPRSLYFLLTSLVYTTPMYFTLRRSENLHFWITFLKQRQIYQRKDIERKDTCTCICILPEFMSVHHMCTVPAEVKRSIGSSGTRVTVVINCRVGANWTPVLWKSSQCFLTIEPFLHPLEIYF